MVGKVRWLEHEADVLLHHRKQREMDVGAQLAFLFIA